MFQSLAIVATLISAKPLPQAVRSPSQATAVASVRPELGDTTAAVTAEPQRAMPQLREATLGTSAGEQVRLSSLRGKPMVLFYEDRDQTEMNAELKKRLFTVGTEQGLLDQVSVVAVANVEGYNWFPARGFVLSAVKATEKKLRIPVYLDWFGSLRAQPWNLSSVLPSVLVLDREGATVLELSGALTEPQRQAVFDALKALVSQ